MDCASLYQCRKPIISFLYLLSQGLRRQSETKQEYSINDIGYVALKGHSLKISKPAGKSFLDQKIQIVR